VEDAGWFKPAGGGVGSAFGINKIAIADGTCDFHLNHKREPLQDGCLNPPATEESLAETFVSAGERTALPSGTASSGRDHRLRMRTRNVKLPVGDIIGSGGLALRFAHDFLRTAG
jgi:hypothetical protein